MIDQLRINTDRKVFVPLQSNGTNYAVSKPFLETHKQMHEEEKEKRIHNVGIKIATIAIVTGFGVLAAMKGLPKGISKKLRNVPDLLQGKIDKLKTSDRFGLVQKLKVKALQQISSWAKFSNAVSNVVPVKDIYFKKITEKIPVVSTVCRKITSLFETIAVRTSTNAYKRAAGRFKSFYIRLGEANKSIPVERQAEVERRISDITSSYERHFGEKAQADRLLGLREGFNGLDEKVWERVQTGKLGTFLTSRSSYTQFLSEDLVVVQKASSKATVDGFASLSRKQIQELLEIYKGILPAGEYAKLEKSANKALKSLDKASKIETDRLFDKLRDIKIGSAPTDVLGIVGALGSVGIGLLSAKNNDERISASLKYGIPAVGAVTVALLCTVSLVSGGPALAIGLGSGLIINKIGAFADRKRKQYQEKPPTISDAINKVNILPTLKEKVI